MKDNVKNYIEQIFRELMYKLKVLYAFSIMQSVHINETMFNILFLIIYIHI